MTYKEWIANHKDTPIQFSELFGMRLKELRKEKDLTQNKVAEILQIPVSTYANYEQGRRDIKIADLIELMGIFDVEPNEMFDDDAFIRLAKNNILDQKRY